MITMTPFIGSVAGARLRVELIAHPITAQRPVLGWLGTDNSTGVSATERRRR